MPSPSSPPKRRSLHTLEGRAFYDPLIDQFIAARKAQGLRQQDVDERIGCADRLVSKWEARVKYPSGYFLVLWAQALNVKLKVEGVPDGGQS